MGISLRHSDNKSIAKLINIFIIAIITLEVLAIALTFTFYPNEDESLYYNKTRLICAQKIQKVEESFASGQSNFTTWKYPYVVLNNKGEVLYASGSLNIGKSQSLESFLQFDNSSAIKYKGYIKSSFPIVINGENKGFFVAFIKHTDLEENSLFKRKLITLTPEVIMLVILSLLLLCFKIFVSKKVLKPIKKITQSSNDIIEGKFDNYVTYNSEDEVGDLSYAFELMRDELGDHIKKEENIKKSEKEVIAAISHDIKTPLSSIKAYVEAIRDGMAETLEEKEEYTSIILKKIDTLNSLVSDLLEQSKADLEVLTIRKKEVSIKPFLQKLIEEIDLELKSKNIEFIWDKGIPEGIINVDNIRIYQAVFNLISNSMKYGKGNLTISFKSYIENRYLFICIEDNGIGISPEDMPYIFNKFYRGDKSRNSRIQGSGLGLSTCKYIVEKHGGEIYCKSLKDNGSTFYFTIPLE